MWLFSNLCRVRDGIPPDFSKVSVLLPYLQDCLNSGDDQVVIDAMWGFVFITDNNQMQCNVCNDKMIIGDDSQ